MRIDKWLWAVRVFKTRTLAASACAKARVRVNGQPAKASRDLQVGDQVQVSFDHMTRTVQVLGLIKQRVGASIVPQHMADLTPQEERDKRPPPDFSTENFHPTKKPGKKERRQWAALLRPN